MNDHNDTGETPMRKGSWDKFVSVYDIFVPASLAPNRLRSSGGRDSKKMSEFLFPPAFGMARLHSSVL
jgi:hypothetical protein